MDLGEPVPARAQLLHAVARPRSTAACDLYRLADAPDAGRDHGRRPFCCPRHHRHHGAQLRLCRLRQRAGDCGVVFRAQGRGSRHRAGGRRPDRQAVAEEQCDACAGGGGICRHLLSQYSLSDHHFWRGADRLCRRLDRRLGISTQGGPWQLASRMEAWSTASSARNCPNIRGRPLRERYGCRAYGSPFGSSPSSPFCSR